MFLPDDDQRTEIGESLSAFQSALGKLSSDAGTQLRCLNAAQDLSRLLQALINRLNRP
jgi:hypothetical protein